MTLVKTAVLLILSASFSAAIAGEIKPFDQQTFSQLTQAGKPVVVDVAASWCPTCKAQAPIIEGLMKLPAYKNVTLLRVDFDTEKPVLREFKVGMQSTLVAFKGAHEVGRSVGDTTPGGLEMLIKKTVE